MTHRDHREGIVQGNPNAIESNVGPAAAAERRATAVLHRRAEGSESRHSQIWRHAVGNMHLDLVADRLGADTLMAGAGDDRIDAGTGSDVVHGGADADEIYGLAGNDVLFGDAGDDVIFGDGIVRAGTLESVAGAEHGNDVLVGGAGLDNLFGDGGDDALYGGEGNDFLYGDQSTRNRGILPQVFDGNDSLDGGAGDDVLFGGDAARDEAASFEGFINSHDALEPGFMRLSANDSGLQHKRSTRKICSKYRSDQFDKIRSRMHTKAVTKRMEKTLSC